MSESDKESAFELSDELYVNAPRTIAAPADPLSAKPSAIAAFWKK